MQEEAKDWKKGLALVLTLYIIGALSGLGFGWHFWRMKPSQDQVKPPVDAPAQQLPGGGVVLPVHPQTHPQPAQQLPSGSHVEHVVSVTVQPNATQPLQPLPGTPNLDPIPCPPVRVDLTLFRDSTGHRRVAASSPDGRVMPGASIDIPEAVGPSLPAPLLNSAGLVFGTTAWGDKSVGVYYDRDWKFIRTGGELTKNTYAIAGRVGWEVRGKIGIIF